MTLSFRLARAEDLDRLVSIHTVAYPDERTHDARIRNFTANPLGTLDDLWVALEDDSIVGHAFLFRMRAWFGETGVPVGGIASVAVAPEARGCGVASRLLDHLHGTARQRGDAVTVLYPFAQGFYGRLGYATTSPYRHLRFSPQAVPWRPELKIRPPVGADRGAMVAAWDAAGRARSGTLIRSKRVWEARWSDQRWTWLVAEGDDGVDGYVAWTLQELEPRGSATLVVREMAARSARGARSLWAAVAAQRDQVVQVHADVADDDPIDRALVDGDRTSVGNVLVPHPIGELALGPMVRIVDIDRALLARGWRGSGRLVFDTGEGAVDLHVSEGVATISPARSEPALRLDRVTLAAVAFGGLRPSQAARLGWLAARDEATLALADVLLGLPPYFSPERF